MSAWHQLLDVQAIDTGLAQLDHRLEHLPERTMRAEIDAKLAELTASAEAVEADKHALVREQKKLEDEIALIGDKIANAEKQLYAGGSDVKHLQALQDEIASFKRRISDLEDKELELMVEVEPLDERLAELASERAPLDEEATQLTATIASSEAEIEAERAALQSDREAAIAGVDEDALAEYEKVRARLGGVAVATLEAGVCGACHIKLSAVEWDRIQHLPADEPVTCEECGRFMVRT